NAKSLSQKTHSRGWPPNQTIAIIPEFTLNSGYIIRNVPVAYKSWGVLNQSTIESDVLYPFNDAQDNDDAIVVII
ncbi:hypothetical protein EDD11_001178, partial [Mortierella claussenii]